MIKLEKLGMDDRKFLIFAGTHAEEIIGQEVFKKLKALSIKKQINITLASVGYKSSYNPNRIFRLSQREFDQIKDKKLRELVRETEKLIQEYEVVIDIHSTNFRLRPYWITVNPTPILETLISKTSLRKVVILDYKHSLIAVAKNGIAIEIGDIPNFDASQIVTKHILELVDSEAHCGLPIDYFLYFGEMKRGLVDKFDPKIEDLVEVKRGQIIGTKNNILVSSLLQFYPLWLERTSSITSCHLLKLTGEHYLFK